MAENNKQAEIIILCHQIYDHYAAQDKVDWDKWWEKTEPFMEQKYINEDRSVYDFMRSMLSFTFKELQVVKGGLSWPIKIY